MTGRQQSTNGQSSGRCLGLEAAKGNRQPAVLDFFCGAGGFTCGSLLAGAKVVCGIDCDGRCLQVSSFSIREPSLST